VNPYDDFNLIETGAPNRHTSAGVKTMKLADKK